MNSPPLAASGLRSSAVQTHYLSLVFFLLTAGLSLPSAATEQAVENNSDSENRGVQRTMLSAVTKDKNEVIPLYEGSHALLIGASRYSEWPRLTSIPSELDAVDEVLSESGFNVERLIDPDSQNLKAGITNFIDSYGYDSENRLLIYFSGHGHSIGDRGFLLPVDIPLPDDHQAFRRKALSMAQIMAWAKDIESKHVLFVFDSCFSGSVFKSKSLPKDRERYIRQATAQPVRQFITAGSANEEVPANSTFTPAFVTALRGEGDLNKDGYITGSELGVHLSQLVPQFVDQTPQYGKIQDYGLSRGDFVFFSSDTAKDKQAQVSALSQPKLPPTDISSDMIEVLVWQSAEKGNTIGDYQAYLDRHPKGNFADIAINRIRILETSLSVPVDVNADRFDYEPETVRIPAGSFEMGSADGDESEQPLRTVTLDAFEIGKYEVTFTEFDEFTSFKATENVSDNGWGRGNRPAINVSWNMARQYTEWLSDRTGRQYRLPLEAEWEYAARAGSINQYSFGDEPELLCNYANIARKGANCTEDYDFTAEVGMFTSNEWGLHDMHGNVWEWTQDCWHPNYHGAPVNGRAWTSDGDCEQRVLRGGAWYSGPEQLRSAKRNKNRSTGGSDSIGFRVVRILDKQPDSSADESVKK